MTWNSKNFCSWRIVRRVEIAENWTRNVWIQKASKDSRSFVNNNILTEFLNSSSKNTDIRISLDKKSDRLWRDWFSCRIPRTECRTTRRRIRNDDNNYDLFDFFVKLFDFTMSGLKKTVKLVCLRNESWWHGVADRSQLERTVKDFLAVWSPDRGQTERIVKGFSAHKKTNTICCWWIKMKYSYNEQAEESW